MPRTEKDDSSFGPRFTGVRKARGLTQIQLAEAAATTQRSIPYYENDDGVPPASAKPPRVERVDDNGETKRLSKRFHMMSALPENDRRAIIRLINSLAAVGATRKNGSLGERNA